jgi:hypothetical protein
MDDTLGHPARPRALRQFLAAAVLTGFAAATPALASPISGQDPLAMTSFEPKTALGWPAFLAAGSTYWATHQPPFITPDVKSWINESVFAPHAASTPMVQYLLWRRSLDPDRFDEWHPQLGPELAHLPPLTTPKVPQVNPKPTPTPAEPQIIPTPLPAPEPAGATLALSLLGGTAWCRLRSRRHCRPGTARG